MLKMMFLRAPCSFLMPVKGRIRLATLSVDLKILKISALTYTSGSALLSNQMDGHSDEM